MRVLFFLRFLLRSSLLAEQGLKSDIQEQVFWAFCYFLMCRKKAIKIVQLSQKQDKFSF